MTSDLPEIPHFLADVFVIMHKVTSTPSILPILLAGISFGCGADRARHPIETPPILLRVAAASDLQPWLGAALREWGNIQNPPVRIDTIYGPTHQLAAQIRTGAPVDLFLAADHEAVSTLVSQGRVNGTSVRPYAVGRIAVLSRKSLGIGTLDDLKRAQFRNLAIASPDTAPYGKAAKSALIARNLWTVLEPKIVVTASVRQAFQSVVDGNADAGIVSLGHARTVAGNPDLMTTEISQDLHAPIVQYLGIVKSDPNEPTPFFEQKLRAIQELIEWLVGPESEALFRTHALTRPTGDRPIMEPEKPFRPTGH